MGFQIKNDEDFRANLIQPFRRITLTLLRRTYTDKPIAS